MNVLELSNVVKKQKAIENWFDKTYSQRAFLYLRPVVAYGLFLELLEVERGKRLLDIACGTGQMLKSAERKNLKLAGIDLSGVAVAKAQTRLQGADIRQENAEELSYKDEYFDYITCLGSLERIIHPEKALSEAYRVLHRNGKACIMVRNSNRTSWKLIKEGLGLINEKGHQGAKTLVEWSSLFENSGFVIEKIHHDQWPLNRWIWWASLKGILFGYNFDKVNASKVDLDKAYEIIFILSKQPK